VRRLRTQDVAGRSARRGARTISEPWRISVLGAASCPEHDTPISAWAGQVLGHWLQVRESLGIPGALAFPGNDQGAPWKKDDHYDGVRRVLRAAGLGDEALAGGSFRLRHTFAKRQLRRSHPREEVARWLGIKNPERLSVYDQRLDEPVANVA
jgi:integrase